MNPISAPNYVRRDAPRTFDNRTVRHDRLDLCIFETIEAVWHIATEWLWTYNTEHPNMGFDGVTPAMKRKMAAKVQRSRPVKTGRIPFSHSALIYREPSTSENTLA